MKQEGISSIVGIILVLVVAAVIVISGIYFVYFTDDTSDDEPLNVNPEGSLNLFITELNSGTAQGIVNSTLAVFSDDYDGSVNMAQKNIIDNDDGIHFELSNYEVIYRNDTSISAQQTDSIINAVDDLESQTNQIVNDSCIIKYKITTILNSTSVTFEGEIPAIQIGSQWYLAIYSITELLDFSDSITPDSVTPDPITPDPEDPVTSDPEDTDPEDPVTPDPDDSQLPNNIITIELSKEYAPITCANFEKYVGDGFFDGLIFHRVIDGFMIQGGAFSPDMTQKTATYAPIDLEINQNLRHIDGAISMARTNDPNSATNQFFICDGAQASLDDSYAVFGQVIGGMDIVRAISSVSTTSDSGHSDVPVGDVIIISASISEESGKTYIIFEVDY